MSARWTEEEFAAYQKRQQGSRFAQGMRETSIPLLAPQAGEPRAKRLDGYASAVEARYAAMLDEQKREGTIKAWFYEPFSLKLAPKLHYRPDFLLEDVDAGLVIVEVKGPYIRDRAMQKVKMAAKLYPCFRFQLAQEIDRVWQVKDLPAH